MFVFLGLGYMLIFLNLDLLKYKAQPDAAANGMEDWVVSERERLKREKEAREVREKALVCAPSFLIFISTSD